MFICPIVYREGNTKRFWVDTGHADVGPFASRRDAEQHVDRIFADFEQHIHEAFLDYENLEQK